MYFNACIGVFICKNNMIFSEYGGYYLSIYEIVYL